MNTMMHPSFVEPVLALTEPPVNFYPNFLSLEYANQLYEFCKRLEWQQNYFCIYGKRLKIPRLEYLEGKPGAVYSYSGGVKLHGKPWSKALSSLCDLIERQTGFKYQICIGNWYADGKQHIGWHSDDDASLGQMPAIASLSLGATRIFQLRKNEKGSDIHKFELHHGSLLLMKPGCQQGWVHRLCKTSQTVGDRINLTFRPYEA